MNIRRLVKSVIPKPVFRTIEPLGHWAEAVVAATKYRFPARKLKVIGVTGTNGKTTTSTMIYQMLFNAGFNVGLTTTVGYGANGNITSQTEHITTAQAGILQKRLRKFADDGVEWVVVETSSHALAQHRVWGIPYQIAVMTNITHDHLDYHGTFRRYLLAKRRLFEIADRSKLRYGVVNADDASADEFIGAIDSAVTYGIDSGEIRATKIKLENSYSTFTAKVGKEEYSMKVNIPGEFNVSNALAAIAVGRKIGLTKSQIEKGIASLKVVEGRMNVIDAGQSFKVIVDFASTPDGFERFFESLRPLVKGRLIAVFGSAGRRDASKRYEQGRIAGRYADVVIATEEDDRDEDGEAILKEIARGAKESQKVLNKNLYMILNREEAIGFALTQAATKNDVVVLLGKGHEKTIERADGEYPWSDSEVAMAALESLQRQTKKKS